MIWLSDILNLSMRGGGVLNVSMLGGGEKH
jgi:hypothetical protein